MNHQVKYIKTLTVIPLLVLILTILPLNAGTLTSKMLHDNVEYRKIQVESSAGTSYVQMILVDRSAIADGILVVEPVPGGENAGATASIGTIAGRTNALACINGPYFANSGSRTYPLGFTVLNGSVYNIGNLDRPLVGLDSDGKLHIEVGHPKVFVANEDYFDPQWLWGINTTAGADNITMYNNSWGDTVSCQGGVAVAVTPMPFETSEADIEISNWTRRVDEYDGEVVEVSDSGSVTIPTGGFALVFKGRSLADSESYTIGTGVAIYSYDLPWNYENLDWITTLGPWFMRDGHLRDYSSETSYGGNITGRASRSMIGLTWNDEIFFAITTGAALTPRQAAEVLAECNVAEAVMCDSGSSSGIWIDTIGTIGSSRAVPMAFIVREATESDSEPVDELRVWEGRIAG